MDIQQSSQEDGNTQVVARHDQQPVIHFTFNNRSGVIKPMSVVLSGISSRFDTLSLEGIYKEMGDGHKPLLDNHHDVETPRALDIRFIDFPIVIEHRETLEKMLDQLEKSHPNAEQERKLIPMRIAVKMSEIAELVAAGKITPNANGMTPVIFEVTDPLTQKVRVGWRFEKDSCKAGDKSHYDHGTVGQNEDATIAWTHPTLRAAIVKWDDKRVRKEIYGIIMKKDGSFSLGNLSYDPNAVNSSFSRYSLNHSPLTQAEVNDIVMISPMPHEDFLPQNPMSNLSVGDKVIAWYANSQRSPDTTQHHDFSEVQDSSHNKRHQGYEGLIISGDPVTQYKHYQTLEQVIDYSLIRPYGECLLAAKEAAKEKALTKSMGDHQKTINTPSPSM